MTEQKKYDVILADPAWVFSVWNKKTGGDRSAEKHYQTTKLYDMAALNVRGVAADNCALFMWCVWPSIFDAELLMLAWGFTYRSKAFTWVKANRSGFGFFMGMGYYSRANDEPCLLAVKGSMPVKDKGVLSVIYAPVRKHSQKPDDQYTKIERLYPGMRYLELFARKRRPGWDAWGNEVEDSIILPG